MQLPGMLVWKAVLADDWSELMMNEELNPWMAKVKESPYQARQDNKRKSIVQKVVQRSTDFLRRIIAPVQEHGVTLSYVCRCYQ